MFNQEKSKLMQTKGQLSKDQSCFFVCTTFDSFLNDLAKDDAILGELAEIADKVTMVQRAKAKQNEILPNLGKEKSIKKERGSYGRE